MGGPLGNQTSVLWGCASQASMITLGTPLGKKFSDNPTAFPQFFPHSTPSSRLGMDCQAALSTMLQSSLGQSLGKPRR